MLRPSRSLPIDPERYVALGRASSLAVSPDGSWLAVSVSRLDKHGGKLYEDLWRVPLVGDGEPVRLTRGPSRDHSVCFRADGALGFLSDRKPEEEGEEEESDREQVWLLPAGGGEPRPITDEPLGVTAFRFAAEADRLVVLARVYLDVPFEKQRERATFRKKHGPTALHFTTMPVRHWDHWLAEAPPHLVAYDGEGGGRRDLTPAADREHRQPEWDLSRDGERVAVTYAVPGADRIDDRSFLIIDTATGKGRRIAIAKGRTVGRPVFSPDGQRLACTQHQRSRERFGKVGLQVYGVSSGVGKELAGGWDRWPVPACWTEDGARIVVTADDRGSVPVFLVDVRTSEVLRVTPREAGGCHEHLALVPGARRLVGLRHRLLHPPEPFRSDLETHAEPELLANLSGFDEKLGRHIASWETFTVFADDGAPVQSFMVTPTGYDPEEGPLPTLLWIHGGPFGQFADGWHWRWNPLLPVARGHAVVLANPRGSTGFGQRFLEGVWGNRWGDQVFRDILTIADAVAERPDVDETRMAAMGASFGGYMTNWIGGNTDRFRCLVTHAGIFSTAGFHGVTDLPAWRTFQMGATPYEDREAYDRYSPDRLHRTWRSPTLVIHGEKDYRVPISEALTLFEALQREGVPSELLVFPDENHWIQRPRNVVAWYDRVMRFLDRHLA